MFGDVGQPELVGGLGAEPALHEVVVDRWSGSAVQSSLLGEDRPDPLLGAQPCDTVLPGGDPAPWQLISDESVAECRIIGVDVADGVDQMCIVPIAL